MQLSRLTDEALLGERRPGFAGPAFAEFYTRHERPVLAFHMRRVRDADVAADLAAETFAQALASLPKFSQQGAGSAAGWLFGVAGNVLATQARKAESERRKRGQLVLERPPLNDELQAAIEQLAGDDGLTAALETLPPDQREAVRARIVDQDGYDEIAVRLGIAPVTARQHVSRGLANLRRRTKSSE